jgi:DNA-binding NarL/FixJ family response regulator
VTARDVVLAQDLIWADRLARAVQAAGADPIRVASLDRFRDALAGADADSAIVDLTALAYDGVAALELATAAGARVLAVGQHEDQELRRRALAAGADRVYAYRKLFEDGPSTIEAWLARSAVVGS